jgi:hypothetical protein
MRSGLRFETLTFAVIAAAVAGCVASGAGQGGDAGAGGSIMMMTGGSGGGAAGNGTGGSGACASPPTAHMSWKFSTGDSNGPFVTCAQLGATTLEVFMNEAHSQFSCAAQSGTTGPLMAGSYTPRLLITAAAGTIIVNDNFPNPITIPSCGVDDLGTLVILVNTSSTGAAGMSGGTAGMTGTAGASGTAGAVGGTGPCNALPIFAMHQCSYPNACHDAKGTAAGFDMASANWQNKLIGISPKAGGGNGFTSQCLAAGMPYLVAGSSPARGLFLEKLKATPICGSQMPALPPLLTAQELDCVQRWANGLTKP